MLFGALIRFTGSAGRKHSCRQTDKSEKFKVFCHFILLFDDHKKDMEIRFISNKYFFV
jgi:hypothetical protein